ncbi:DUF4179 domain-containing protein [Clostridium lundense]|uniref:DUF4179 domain-containing protein n=1 Tax=Clostridium lundense TaxID=319475 RepID=UPI0004840D2F|nr:DUF4179 domain-containing protein [Clostridium lundense]
MDCEKIKDLFIDYIDGTLDEEAKLLIQNHINSCTNCKNELYKLQQIHTSLKKSSNKIIANENFIDNIKNKIDKSSVVNRKKIKRFRVALIACIILTLSIFTVIASEDGFIELIKAVTKVESLNKNVEKGYGDIINSSSIDKNIKVTVKYAVADDLGTAIFYEIEDLDKNKKYTMELNKESFDVNKYWTTDVIDASDNFPTSSLFNLYNEKNNISSEKLALPAIKSSEEEINLKINKLISKDDKKEISGNWSFNFKVKKHPIKTYTINKEVNIDGYNIKFTTIKIAPTKTLLGYEVTNKKDGEEFRTLNNINLKYKDKYLPTTIFGGSYSNSSGEIPFESIYFMNPDKISINIKNYVIEIPREESFIIDPNKPFPQKFKYLGSTLSVTNMIYKGENLYIDINYGLDNRKFEILYFKYDVLNKNYQLNEKYSLRRLFSTSDGIFMDQYKNKYSYFEGLNMIFNNTNKKLSLYVTTSKSEGNIYDNKLKDTLKNVENLNLPIKITVESYTSTNFIDKKINVKLK